MNKIYKLIFVVLLTSANLSYGDSVKQVAVTLDDLPTISYDGLLNREEQVKYFHDILAILEKHKVKVIGFVNGSNLNGFRHQLLDEFCRRGHLVGNHTYSHPDLNDVNCSEYMMDISQGEESVKKYMEGRKYFRYPMLHRGNTLEKRDTIFSFLAENDYIIVPVSIDNEDFLYNINYIKMLKAGDTVKADSIGRQYIKHIIGQSNYFDSLAVIKTGRQIKHILLLHMNYINSIYLDDLLTWYENNGWQIITTDEALDDPVYALPDTYVGKKGVSYIERIE